MSKFDHHKLDDVIHSRIRLAIVALLSSVDRADFRFLREKVNTTNGNLGMHLGKLEEAGYVEVEKGFVDRKPVSRYSLTSSGRRAFETYLLELEDLLAAAREARAGRRAQGSR